MTIIYKRTSKGDEEIAKRIYKLDHEHRFVLIMVDGKASSDSIISRSSEQWNPQKCLLELEIKGFIQNINISGEGMSDISEVKQNLILAIQKLIPNNNTKIVNKILNSRLVKSDLSKAIDSSCIFVKLTISEDISVQLKSELHQILDASIDA